MIKPEHQTKMSRIIAWAMVVVAASTVPALFGRNVWTFGFQALMCVVAFTQISKKQSAVPKK
ncbi:MULTISPECIES: hypothetical protein [Pediococcus]|uniref:Uncharacterized protein n=2 Tax=Pediococcus acidilactici TaxID=1254 RepID=E0NH95_PEDAC|nr:MULTISPECIES: hypothetical protein [Pediococcus]AZP89905.1 hypothetical protein CYD95_00490 [Pediococcus acidilactici]EFL95106.1 hypothetical protein HMPREF0623_1418 [Pediococcus acidilactici DSM 20284]KAF0370086.1 hypothetical protein GBO60_08850 [Pediococcus acidilactici]KAF0388764.1 hypothetical protein GBO67_08850 [Pediococcus acidilactici]MBW9300806.1 hypothetical protein [Pediococcus acidilactici]